MPSRFSSEPIWRLPSPCWNRPQKRTPRIRSWLGHRGELQILTMLGVTRITGFGQVSASSAALRKSPEAVKAREEIEASSDPNVLGAAGDALLRYAPSIRQTFSPYSGPDPTLDQDKFRDWAEQWLTKAHESAPQEDLWTAGLIRAYERHTFGDAQPAEQVKWLRKADALATRDEQRGSFLPRLAMAEFEAGDLPPLNASPSGC
jgi:hypothetical protein